MAENVDLRELQLKSAFLYKISKFVQWPSELVTKDNGSQQSFNICVANNIEFYDFLTSSTKNRQLKNKTIRIWNVLTVDNPQFCQLIYLHDTNVSDTKLFLNQLANKPVLTIGSGSSFTELGGMIRFVQRKNNIGFVINNSLAKNVKLKINAHLLRLSEVK